MYFIVWVKNCILLISKCTCLFVNSLFLSVSRGFNIGSVCSDQTGLGFEPVWRTTHLRLNRKRFDHLLYTKLKPVYQADQPTPDVQFGMSEYVFTWNKNGGHRTFFMKSIVQKWIVFTNEVVSCYLDFVPNYVFVVMHKAGLKPKPLTKTSLFRTNRPIYI